MQDLNLYLKQDWWVLFLRGVISIIFGIALFIIPKMSLLVLMYIFGFTAILDGCINLFLGFKSKNYTKKWWMILLSGVFGILLGILAIFYPLLTAFSLTVFMGLWILALGVSQIIIAFEASNKIFLIINGILSFIIGLILLINPAAGALAFVWIIGLYSILYGIILAILSFKIKKN